MAFTKICAVSEVPPGHVTEARINGDAYAICNVNGVIRAVWGVCPHANGPLGQGTLEGSMLVCPWHLWAFDCTNGDLKAFSVKVEGGDLFVDPECHA